MGLSCALDKLVTYLLTAGCCQITTLILHPFNGFFSKTTCVNRYQKGKTNLDINEATGNGVLGCSDISWTICTSLLTDNHTNTSSLNFYRPDALPDAQRPNQQCQSTEGTLVIYVMNISEMHG